MSNQKKTYQSMFQQKIQLDSETKQKFKNFASRVEEWKNKPVEESEFSRTVICGEKEFKQPKTGKKLK